MNVRILSLLAMAIVVLASVGTLAVAEQSQAEPDEDETHEQEALVLSSTGSSDRTYQVNEKQFEGYRYTMTWSIAERGNSGDFSDITNWSELGSTSNSNAGTQGTFTSELDVSVDNFNVSMMRGAVGKYTMTVTSPATVLDGANLVLRCDMKITVDGNEITLSKVYYAFSVVISEQETMLFDELKLKVGELYGAEIIETTGMISKVGSYHWYAVGLPEGISMSDSGYISGVPLKETSADAIVKIVATNKDTGATYTGDLTVSVGPAVGTLTSYGFEVRVNNVEKGGPNYYAVQGEVVTLKTYSDPGKQTLADAISVTVVDTDGRVNAIINNGIMGNYTIPTNGTGAYRVVMTFGSSDNIESAEFYLFVSPSLNDISAGITITGN